MVSHPLRTRIDLLASAFLLAMTVIHIVLLVRFVPLLRSGYQDFTTFYTAGTLLREGRATDLYDLSIQSSVQREFAPNVAIRKEGLPFIHAPFEALIFWPLAFLKFQHAYIVWTLLNALMLAVVLGKTRLLIPGASESSWSLLFLAATGYFPIAEALIHGQDTILLLLALIFGLTWLSQGRDVAGGATMALALFKFHLISPIVLLLALRRPRLLLGFVPAGMGLVLLSVAVVGWHGAAEYVHFVLGLQRSGAGGAIRTVDMPNLHGLVAHPPVLTFTFTAEIATTILTSVTVLLWAAIIIGRQKGSIVHSFAIASITAILVSYYALPHDLSLAFPAALMLFFNDEYGHKASARVLLAILFMTPLYLFLWFRLDRMCWFSMILLVLLWQLSRSRATTVRPIQGAPQS